MVVGSCWPDMEAVITMGGGGCWPRMDTFMVVCLLARHGSSHSNGWLLVSNGEVVWIGGSDLIFFRHADEPESWSRSRMWVLFLHEVAGQQ